MAKAFARSLGVRRISYFAVCLVLATGLALSYSQAASDRDIPRTIPVRPDQTKALPSSGKSGDADKANTINIKLRQKWKENKVAPSARTSDFEFIRRASLDIIGRIATPEEIALFLKDPVPTRRALLIERLLKSKEYAKNWANIWTVLLMTRSGANEAGRREYHQQMHQWLEEQFAENRSHKDLVIALLTATGKSSENGAVNYILSNLGESIPKDNQEGLFTMVPVTSRTTRLFLGVQTQCTQCHDHPFNTGKQVNFWGINAFFRQVDAPKGRPDSGRMAMRKDLELTDNPALDAAGDVIYENRKALVFSTKPFFFLDEAYRFPGPAVNRRQELARLITNSPYFAKAYVNRMWMHFFGKGFTNPVDDFGEHNEPSCPELLDELANEFVHYGYDPKRLIRWICNSEAYSLSCVSNKTNENRTNEKGESEPLFSRMLLKAMTPEQLFESLTVATRAELFESKENRTKWMESLTANFGDDEGNEVTFNGTVVQALLMMNGTEINTAITKGTVAQALQTRKTPKGLLDQLYLAALNRPATVIESEKILRIYRGAPVKSRDQLSFWQDLFWALLNSNEFVLNH